MGKFKLGIIQPRLSYYIGGGEKFAYYHSKLLPGTDYEIYLYTTDIPNRTSFLFKDLVNRSNANLYIRQFKIPEKYKYLYDINAGDSRVRWDVESLMFNQLIYSQIENDNLNAILNYYIIDGLFKPHSIRNILYLLGYSNNQSEYWQSFFRFFDATISISDNVKNKWSNHMDSEKPNLVLHSGVDLPTINSYKFDTRNINIIFAGRLIERKGILTLIKAISVANKKVPNIRLHILGDGILRDKIVAEIKEHNLQQLVKLYGIVEDPQLYFNSADICIFPSHEKEGLMGTVMEAMMCGKAIITTTDNGNEDIIQNNISGVLVAPYNVEMLASEIIKLSHDKEMRKSLGSSAKKYAMSNLTWDKHIEKLKEIIY